tara:strand:- start:4831 stop:5028 length:198 start_codon:yes stop_codon:yes gene_type:complete
MAKTVFDVLSEQIDSQLESAKEFLSSGAPKSYEGYREVVGLIRGLESSKSLIVDLARNYMDDEDD